MMKKNTKFSYTSNLSNLLIRNTLRLQDAIPYLKTSNLKSLIVVDENRSLLGHFSDGDLRRFVLNNGGTDGVVGDAMVEVPLSRSVEKGQSIRDLMPRLDKSVKLVPLIDEGKVVGAYRKEDLSQSTLANVTLYILAGGQGVRMLPLTVDCPKPMLLVRGKPMLEHIIVNAVKQGIRRICISVGYLAEKIIEYFGDGTFFGVEIVYVSEKKPLGTAGSLALIEDETIDRLIVMNGDVLTGCDFESLIGFHEKLRADATICVKYYEIKNPYGAVKLENFNLLGFEEKPVVKYQINAGIYVLEKQVRKLVPKMCKIDMPELLLKSQKENLSVCGFPLFENWNDIGNPKELAEMQKSQSDND